MTGTPAAPADAQASVTAYEHLRRHVLTGTPGDAPGLVLLLRAGVAAWSVRAPGGVATPTTGGRAEDEARAAEAPHASLIRILASMALAHGHERSRR